MAAPVKILVAGLPAEMVREIGLRLRDTAVSEFENAQQMGRAAAHAETGLVILSDALPTEDAIYVARRARDASDEMRVAFCISMQQAENALLAVKDLQVDRFFLMPVDKEEMLLELSKMCRVEVLPPNASHGEHIAAAVFEAWDRAKPQTFEKIDKLDDAAIALLDNDPSPELKAAAERDAQTIAETVEKFGFQKGARVARDLAERLASESLSPVDGVPISEQLLALRESLLGPPSAPHLATPASEKSRLATPGDADPLQESQLEGRRVLVVDDEPMVSRGLTSLLSRRGLAVTALNDPLRFWNVLEETKPNLILLDLEMPRISGTELCRVVRSDRRWSELPVIFLTGHTDPLTGLATALKATELIDRFLRLARRKSDPYSIAVLQIDALASLTSNFGRAMTDSVLRTIGGLLPKSFRAEDVPGWWGGPDFTIGMYGSTKEHAAIKLAQICAKVAELNFIAEDGRRVHVATSAGVAQYQTDGETVDALREEALKALEKARATAGNPVGVSGVKAAGAMTRRVDVAIVDDDPVLVALLKHAMESRSMRVATYTDGEAAMAALTGADPEVQASVILLDVDLPALNGLDVLRRLKAGDISRLSNVVMLTARTGERDVLAALEMGATDHITKPFSVPVLMHKVRTALKQAQSW